MKHPTPADWIGYLYDESDALPELRAHLAECVTCQEQLKQWQLVKTSLDSWKLPVQKTRFSSTWGKHLRWAAAAILLISAGFISHQLAFTRQPDLQSLARAIEPQVRQSVQAAVSQKLQEQWQDDLKAIQARLDRQQGEFEQLLLTAVGQSSSQTKKALGGILTVYQLERQQWAEAIQALQIQRESDQSSFHDNLTRLAVATEQEIQRANDGLRALAQSVKYDSELNDRSTPLNPQ